MKERVKALEDLFEPEEIDFMLRVAEIVGNANLNHPVLYAGSGGDLEHAVVLGNDLIFVDSHKPDITLNEIRSKIEIVGGEILEEREIGVLGRGGKRILTFRFCGDTVRLTYYAEDATKFVPPEAKGGISVYFVKVPHPKEPNVGSLSSPESLSKYLSLIEVGGFYLERECPLPRNAEEFGFVKVLSGYISALSIHDAEGNLYRKVRDVPNLYELLSRAMEIETCSNSRASIPRSTSKMGRP